MGELNQILPKFGDPRAWSSTDVDIGRGDGVFEERRRNLAQERAYAAYMAELERQKRWLDDFKLQQSLVPPEWSRIEAEVPVRPHRTKITVDLDEEVAKWFRRMGHGYQRRINAVLRTYMLALISKEILSDGDRNREGREIWGLPAKKEKKPGKE